MGEKINFHWHETPQEWSAIRGDIDGAVDSKQRIGYGKTKDEAMANLLEWDAEYCPKCDSGDTSFVYVEDCGLTYQKCGNCGEEWGHS